MARSPEPALSTGGPNSVPRCHCSVQSPPSLLLQIYSQMSANCLINSQVCLLPSVNSARFNSSARSRQFCQVSLNVNSTGLNSSLLSEHFKTKQEMILGLLHSLGTTYNNKHFVILLSQVGARREAPGERLLLLLVTRILSRCLESECIGLPITDIQPLSLMDDEFGNVTSALA
jgi:hypothetical protein